MYSLQFFLSITGVPEPQDLDFIRWSRRFTRHLWQHQEGVLQDTRSKDSLASDSTELCRVVGGEELLRGVIQGGWIENVTLGSAKFLKFILFLVFW